MRSFSGISRRNKFATSASGFCTAGRVCSCAVVRSSRASNRDVSTPPAFIACSRNGFVAAFLAVSAAATAASSPANPRSAATRAALLFARVTAASGVRAKTPRWRMAMPGSSDSSASVRWTPGIALGAARNSAAVSTASRRRVSATRFSAPLAVIPANGARATRMPAPAMRGSAAPPAPAAMPMPAFSARESPVPTGCIAPKTPP